MKYETHENISNHKCEWNIFRFGLILNKTYANNYPYHLPDL
jgi:hypothetical protein